MAMLFVVLGMRFFIDIGGLPPHVCNHTVEDLYKAVTATDAKIWQPHPRPEVAVVEEWTTAWGSARLRDLYLTLRRKLGLPDARTRPAEGSFAKAVFEVEARQIASKPFHTLSLGDFRQLVEWAVEKYLPERDLARQAEAMAVKSYLMGRIGEHLKEREAAEKALDTLPSILKQAAKAYELSELDRLTIAYGKEFAGIHIQEMKDAVRLKVRKLVVQAHREGAQPPAISQRLFDTFSDLNRDWRRIAVTEAAENAGQGFLSSLPPGTVLVRREAADACGFCKELDGQEVVLVPPDKESKDWDREVWLGKTNVGRSRSPMKRTMGGLTSRSDEEMWKPAAGVQHPHCRGWWERKLEPPEVTA